MKNKVANKEPVINKEKWEIVVIPKKRRGRKKKDQGKKNNEI